MSAWQWQQLIGFQIFWLVAVLGGNHWLWVCALLLGLHFIYSPARRDDLQVIPLAVAGIAIDSVLTLTGVFQFNHWPFWLALLWVGFVLTLYHSLRWLRSMPVYAQSLFGALGGTGSYLAGAKLNAVHLPLSLPVTLVVLSCLWALLLPGLVKADAYVRGSQ